MVPTSPSEAYMYRMQKYGKTNGIRNRYDDEQ